MEVKFIIMQSQNVNLIKPNKSSLPPQINIYQLPQLYHIQPPLFNRQAAQPLSLTHEQVKMLFKKPSTNPTTFLPANKPSIPPKISLPLPNNELQTLRKQNQQLNQKLTQMTRLYQQQKFKYNELKNLYKEGQAMFEILEDKKITLEKQNKQLRLLLENFYQQLHSENQHFQGQDKKKQQLNKIPITSTSTTSTNIQTNKIQKVKIGNKKIPVIKVNVPPQTFTKKEHSSSVFSQNSDFNSIQTNNNNKQEISILKQEVQQLKGMNYQLQRKMNEVKEELEKSKRLVEEYERKQSNVKNPVVTFKQHIIQTKKQNYNEKQHQNITPHSSFDFRFNKIENTQFSQIFSQGQMSQFHHQDKENVSYYKSKYSILQTQVKKKDDTIKNLYNQCYSLQAEINRLKTQSSSMQPTLPGSSRDTRQSWTQQKHLSHFNVNKEKKQPGAQNMNESFHSKGEWYYQSKINQLQKRINELNQMCISNVNQSFRINEMNDTITKLTIENNQYEQKIRNLQAQLSRLYKILENKNTQLSQIYTTITQSKRNYGLDESKKKSFNNIFINTPEKNQQFSSKNLFYSKGFSKDQSFH